MSVIVRHRFWPREALPTPALHGQRGITQHVQETRPSAGFGVIRDTNPREFGEVPSSLNQLSVRKRTESHVPGSCGATHTSATDKSAPMVMDLKSLGSFEPEVLS